MAPKRDSSSSTTDDISQSILDHLDTNATLITTQFDALHTTLNTALTAAISNLPTASANATAAAIAQLVPAATQPPYHNPPPIENPPPNPHTTIRPPKIHFPTFDGSNPLDWLFQATNYFEYYSVRPTQRLALAQFYFTGEALNWYKYLANNNLLTSWPEFSRALELRFGPSSFENHQAALFKLQQTTTVTEYVANFERLSNLVVGLPSNALLNCFLSGLQPTIQNELSILKPTSFTQAVGLAKLVEEKLSTAVSQMATTPTVCPQPPAILPTPTTANPTFPTATPSLPTAKLSPDQL